MSRRCFNGYAIEVLDKRDRLPNVKFGFTSRLYECHDIEGALRAITMTKILLDSDGAYRSLVSISKGLNTPWVIIQHPRRIAEIKE